MVVTNLTWWVHFTITSGIFEFPKITTCIGTDVDAIDVNFSGV